MLSFEAFETKARKVHNNYYPEYNKNTFTKALDPVDILCPEHGWFQQVGHYHLAGSGCAKCFRDRRTISLQEFIVRSNIAHNFFFDYALVSYINNRTKVKIVCPTHGMFEQVPEHHMNGNNGCRKCFGKDVKKRFEHTMEEFVRLAHIAHNGWYDYSLVEYIDNKHPVIIICPDHGQWHQRPDSHLRGHGCKKCVNASTSKPETEWLKYIGVPPKQQQVSLWINGSRIVVDGYHGPSNTIYEFHGDFWHGNPEKYKPDDINPMSKKSYGELYDKTMKREKIITDNGFKLITIWESDWKKMQKKEEK